MTELSEGLARGYYAVDYSLNGSIDRLATLKEWLMMDQPRFTGWPPFAWIQQEPYRPVVIDEHTYRSTIAAHNLRRPHYERWTASTLGKFTMVRAHDLDHSDDYGDQHVISLTTPVWRVAEVMLHAGRMAARFEANEIEFTIQFTGLAERRLVSLPESNRVLLHDCQTGAAEYKKAITLEGAAIEDGVAAFTDQLMRPFYELFEFTLPAELCEQELAKMRSNRF